MTPPYESAAWVAEADGELLGHVALHRADRDPTLSAAARATGRTADGLAVLARLIVCPHLRRHGVGRALLEVALEHAGQADQRVVLDVEHGSQAEAFYEALGWYRVEPLRLDLDRGRFLDLWVYVSPDRAG
jgi:predicted N-acetyltransferase YhbS